MPNAASRLFDSTSFRSVRASPNAAWKISSARGMSCSAEVDLGGGASRSSFWFFMCEASAAKAWTATSAARKTGTPAFSTRRRVSTTPLSPSQAVRKGLAHSVATGRMPSATDSALAIPVGQNTVSTASTSGSAATMAAAPPKRAPSASPITSTGFALDQCFGRIASRRSIVSGASLASWSFSALTASAARTPGPPPLVTTASRSP